eukprot:TRINITY_DN15464_c0_g1_i1.p2 TRINITY_DN15464_c0_g1~~TRINITY_DN15464_c0_g1_i1.p2  ORF type:complete len:159 (+),score=18.92 TRINITY_DN15464_c0_g1_i1:209-685(+)
MARKTISHPTASKNQILLWRHLWLLSCRSRFFSTSRKVSTMRASAVAKAPRQTIELAKKGRTQREERRLQVVPDERVQILEGEGEEVRRGAQNHDDYDHLSFSASPRGRPSCHVGRDGTPVVRPGFENDVMFDVCEAVGGVPALEARAAAQRNGVEVL